MENGKSGGYQNSETPKPTVTKFDKSDITLHAITQCDCPSGDVPANRLGDILYY